MWHVLVNETWGLAFRLFHQVAQLNYVGTAIECLKNLDLPVNLFCLDGFQYFDDCFLLVRAAVAEKYLGILATTELVMHLVVVDVAPLDIHRSVERVILRSIVVNIIMFLTPFIVGVFR